MRKSHEHRKAEIIQATIDLAARDETPKLTTQAIADSIGISQPTVFKHFRTSDLLFSSVIEWIASNLLNLIDSIISNPEDAPHQKLQKLIEAQLIFVGKHKGIPRLLFSKQVHSGGKGLKTVVQTMLRSYIDRLVTLLKDGITSGEYRPDLDPEHGAKLIAYSLQGVVLRWSLHDFEFDLLEEYSPLLTLINTNIKGSQPLPL